MKIILFILLFSLNCFSQNDCAKVDSNFTGYCNEYYENGNVKWAKQFENGKAVGVWLNFDLNGKYEKQVNTDEKQDSLDLKYDDFNPEIIYCGWGHEEAKFDGGEIKLNQWIEENLIYPQEAILRKVEGKCYVQFTVEENGSISNVKIRKGIANCPECEQEAMRIVSKMPKWKPLRNCGIPKSSNCELPINFTLK